MLALLSRKLKLFAKNSRYKEGTTVDRGLVIALVVVGIFFFGVVTKGRHIENQRKVQELQSQLCDKERELQLLRFGTYKADCEK